MRVRIQGGLGLLGGCFQWRRIYLFLFVLFEFFVFGLGGRAVSRLSVPWVFGQVLASCFPWLLRYSVSGLLGHSPSYGFLVLYGLLASRFPWLLGFSASRLVGLSTSCK